MHIMIIPSEPFTPEDLPLGGIFQKDLANALQENGIKVGVISIHFKSIKNIKQNSQIEIFKFSRPNRFKYPVLHFSSLMLYTFPGLVELAWLYIGKYLLKKYIEKFGTPDLIHAHNCLYAGSLALFAKKKYNIEYILTEHYSGFLRNTIPANQINNIKKICNGAASVTAVSNKLANALNKEFHIKKQVEVIPNLMDEEFEKVRLPNLTKKENFVFLNVARMDSNKGQEYLLKAFSLKFSNNKNIQLRIGGDGYLRQKLIDLARELKIQDQVTFLGELSREEVKEEMLNSNAFILTSNSETFGVVLIEAMACGKPLISTKSGGPNDIITKENGILAECGNLLSIGDAMEYLYLNINSYNPHQIRKTCLENYGRVNIINKYLKLYKLSYER